MINQVYSRLFGVISFFSNCELVNWELIAIENVIDLTKLIIFDEKILKIITLSKFNRNNSFIG